MEDIIDGFRFLIMFSQVAFYAVTFVAFYTLNGKDKMSAGFWLIMLTLNFWLLYQAAVNGGLI